MSNSYRLDQIYATLIRQGSATVEELSQTFHVTPTTIRRDLLVLEEMRLINRSRGVAFLIDHDRTAPNIYAEEKKRIAAKTASLIPEGATLSLDSGTTVEALVTYLLNNKLLEDLNIVTHSMSTALLACSKYNVSVPGGALFKKVGAMVGFEVEEYYKKINVDLAILGSTGVLHCSGLTLSYPIQLMVKKAAAECADKRIAVLDSSKFIRRGIYVFSEWDTIDTLVTVQTDENKAQIDRIANMGVNIVLA